MLRLELIFTTSDVEPWYVVESEVLTSPVRLNDRLSLTVWDALNKPDLIWDTLRLEDSVTVIAVPVMFVDAERLPVELYDDDVFGVMVSDGVYKTVWVIRRVCVREFVANVHALRLALWAVVHVTGAAIAILNGLSWATEIT